MATKTEQALSYTWGPPHPERHVYVNGKAYPIRINLYRFFECVWADVDYYGDLILWVDQVCIDQSTVAERNHQVAQMSRIFRQAERVLIWLGLNNLRSSSLMDGLNALPVILPPYGPHDGEWYEHISSQPYWGRLWIIQEVVLARSLVVVWGTRKVNWDVLMKFLVRVRRNHPQWQETHLDNVRIARGMRRADGTYQLSWEMALRLSEGSKCQEIRDKIYGLLGLVDPALRVRPDYSKEPIDIVSDIIEEQAKLLCLNTNFRADRDLFAIWDLCREELGLSSEPPESAVRAWERTIASQLYHAMPYGPKPDFSDADEQSGAKDDDDDGKGVNNKTTVMTKPRSSIGDSMDWKFGF